MNNKVLHKHSLLNGTPAVRPRPPEYSAAGAFHFLAHAYLISTLERDHSSSGMGISIF